MATLQDELNGTQPPVDASPEETCTYIVPRSGNRCDQLPVEGETVCLRHGASIAKAKEQATRFLLSLQMKSLRKLDKVLDEEFDNRVVVSAINSVLDRTGHGSKSTVEIEEKKQDLSALTYDQIQNELETLSEKFRAEKSKRHRMNEALASKKAPSAPDIH